MIQMVGRRLYQPRGVGLNARLPFVDSLFAKSIWWQGNEYDAWPMQVKHRVQRRRHRITALCLAFDDLPEFKLTMRHTLGTYLALRTFPAAIRRPPLPRRRSRSDTSTRKRMKMGNGYLEFASPGDVGGESVGRKATTLCHWCLTGEYRGPSCGYTAPYVTKDGEATDDPELDECDATLGRAVVLRALAKVTRCRANGLRERRTTPASTRPAGFYRVDQPQRGDMIVMEVGRTVHPNHAGIFLGDDPSLPGEDAETFGPGPFLLHHLYGRPSEIIVLADHGLIERA